MDPINLLRLGQVIQRDMLDRAALDRLEWTPQPWLQWVGSLFTRTWKTVTKANNAVQKRAKPAQVPVDDYRTTPDMSTESC